MMSLVCLKNPTIVYFQLAVSLPAGLYVSPSLPWYQVSSWLVFVDVFALNSPLITVSHRIKRLCFLAWFSLKSQELQSQALPMMLKID